MTTQEIKQLIEEVKPHLDPSKEIDKSNDVIQQFIKAYKKVTGKTLGAGNCKNCIMDAFFEWKTMSEKQLEFLTMERKYKIKETRVVGFNNGHYTKANITDEIALEMVAFNRNHANSFDNGDELLADFDEMNKPKKEGVTPIQTIEGASKKRGRKPKAK